MKRQKLMRWLLSRAGTSYCSRGNRRRPGCSYSHFDWMLNVCELCYILNLLNHVSRIIKF